MKLEAALLRCEHERDELSTAVFQVRAEAQGKIRQLRCTVQVSISQRAAKGGTLLVGYVQYFQFFQKYVHELRYACEYFFPS